MDTLEQVAQRIIREQENVIGPLALEQAKKVAGLTIENGKEVKLTGDKTQTINHLVEQYKKIFGQTSVEVSKNAVHTLIASLPPQEVPSLLR